MFDRDGQTEAFKAAHEQWEKETLEPTLKKAPEQERNAGFTTISGEPIERLYTPLDIATAIRSQTSAFPASIRSHVVFIPPAIAASSGRCECSPVSAPPKKPTSASSIC
jgi:hypothetical protein